MDADDKFEVSVGVSSAPVSTIGQSDGSSDLIQPLLDGSLNNDSIEEGECSSSGKLSRRLTRMDGLGLSVRMLVFST